ncbi:PAC2 family protein [Brachybacterium hainanense]|uniref:PAC2 family protein n=1 Tax=Brachybacterium hainanense TaxID=1541174 RepID=A0ABV6RFX5_9MICO
MDPTTLFSYERHVDSRSLNARVLLVTLGAFSDAAAAQATIDDHLLNTLPSRVVGRLDMDQIYDYAGRRPEVTLELDHFQDYETPQILLHEVTSPDGETFFLLTGPEPSFQWERVASALKIMVEQLGIERTLMLQSFPAPVPHTRELPVTRFAGDPDVISVRRPMPGVFRLRAPFTAMLTLRLAEAGHAVVGLVVHVPQYLSDVLYPDAAIELLKAVREEQGPDLPTGALETQAAPIRESIAAQVGASPQLQELVRGFEQQYDRMITDGRSHVPTGDDIAAEVEKYLAGLDSESGGDAPSGPDASADPSGPDSPSGPDGPEDPGKDGPQPA